jgi:hypothetical protein
MTLPYLLPYIHEKRLTVRGIGRFQSADFEVALNIDRIYDLSLNDGRGTGWQFQYRILKYIKHIGQDKRKQ